MNGDNTAPRSVRFYDHPRSDLLDHGVHALVKNLQAIRRSICRGTDVLSGIGLLALLRAPAPHTLEYTEQGFGRHVRGLISWLKKEKWRMIGNAWEPSVCAHYGVSCRDGGIT